VLHPDIEGERARAAAETVARTSYGKLVAYLARDTRDVAAAEDALADAFAAALTDWPVNGCPTSPEAWLLTVARRKSIDAQRRRRTAANGAADLALVSTNAPAAPDIPDHRLGLLFACAHPAIDASVRAPLMLQTVLGLKADAIAAAYLTSPAAMAKRLGRAKQKIREAGIPLRIPDRDELAARLDAVLDAIYGAFGEGWNDSIATGAAHALTDEALFLAGLVAELLPDEPEALGLNALLLYVDARRAARRDPAGEYVPLTAQDRSLWNRAQLDAAEALLHCAHTRRRIGRYQLEAALQSAHVHRLTSNASNWADVVTLYDALLALSASPVVAINRAVAVAELNGAAAGLAALDALIVDTQLASYQPYWAARAELHAQVGDPAADHAYQRAIGLTQDPAVRRYLRRRQKLIASARGGTVR
jgi:predicted RNA polymerase sigma factor